MYYLLKVKTKYTLQIQQTFADQFYFKLKITMEMAIEIMDRQVLNK